MKLDEINLHDALLKAMRVDYVAKSISIDIAYYKTEQSPCRQEATIDFKKVESISQITDLDRLKNNAFAGNINYWIPSKEKGITYIYLMDGCISIDSAKVSFKKIQTKPILQR